ncbi:MAG: glycosylated S-layer protein, SlaA, partial [Saccharolobus sp.]
MNKSLGLILTSIFLISTLGIIPGLVLTTQASPPPNTALPVYTLPHVTTITNTTSFVNVFLNPYDNSLAKAFLSSYYYGEVINYTINSTTIYFLIKGQTYHYTLSNETVGAAAYYDPSNVSVFFVINLQGNSNSPYTSYEKVVNFEISANLPSSSIYNYDNNTINVADSINAINLGWLLYQATGGEY